VEVGLAAMVLVVMVVGGILTPIGRHTTRTWCGSVSTLRVWVRIRGLPDLTKMRGGKQLRQERNKLLCKLRLLHPWGINKVLARWWSRIS
jgi:hypothetical protein